MHRVCVSVYHIRYGDGTVCAHLIILWTILAFDKIDLRCSYIAETAKIYYSFAVVSLGNWTNQFMVNLMEIVIYYWRI